VLVHLKDLGSSGATVELGKVSLDIEQIHPLGAFRGSAASLRRAGTARSIRLQARHRFRFLERFWPPDRQPQSRI